MKFANFVEDIKKLSGLKLQSIRKGADITVQGVDLENNRVKIVTSQGKEKTRPLVEFKKIWEALCDNTAIHVDSILLGSGSSRNQPETIIANLPYIEWFRFQGKKHITLVDKYSHEYGTLKEMDPVDREAIKDKMLLDDEKNNLVTIIITDQIQQCCGEIEQLFGKKPKSLEMGVYKQTFQGQGMLIVSTDKIPFDVEVGTYVVIKTSRSAHVHYMKSFKIQEIEFYPVSSEAKIMVHV